MHWLWNEAAEEFLPDSFPTSPLPPTTASRHLRSAATRSSECLRIAAGQRLTLEANPYNNTSCDECIGLVKKVFAHPSELPALPLRGCVRDQGCDLSVCEYWRESDGRDSPDEAAVDDPATSSPAPTSPDPADRLRQARQLLEDGLIDDVEYASVKQAVLRELGGESHAP